MMQIPNLPNCCTQQFPQPNYNAVKIDVHNPMVNVPAQVPAPGAHNPQYEAPTMPYYQYPQAPVQPYYMPPVINTPETVQQVEVPKTVATQETAPVAAIPPQVEVKEIPVESETVPPAPVVTEAVKPEEKKITEETPTQEVKTETPVEEKPVEIVAPQEIKPQVDLNAFLAKLTNEDYDVQAAAMNSIAEMVDKEPEKATELLDTKIVDALTNIIKNDTSALEGPTAETEAARQAIIDNKDMKDEEKLSALESTITSKEKAERNKSYAMFTAAIMQKLYNDEVQKLTNSTVPLTELPGAVTIVEQLKSNPNPMVRSSAIDALSYIQNPSYKKDLNTIFTIAQQDQDKNVQESAKAALAKLSEVPDLASETSTQEVSDK